MERCHQPCRTSPGREGEADSACCSYGVAVYLLGPFYARTALAPSPIHHVSPGGQHDGGWACGTDSSSQTRRQTRLASSAAQGRGKRASGPTPIPARRGRKRPGRNSRDPYRRAKQPLQWGGEGGAGEKHQASWWRRGRKAGKKRRDHLHA